MDIKDLLQDVADQLSDDDIADIATKAVRQMSKQYPDLEFDNFSVSLASGAEGKEVYLLYTVYRGNEEIKTFKAMTFTRKDLKDGI